MKSILLASASVLAFAGAAAAEISWSGVATLGFNDGEAEDGFYWDLEIDVVLSQTLDNGLTAGAEFGFEAVDDDGAGNLGQDVVAKDFVLFLESDTAALYFGDTDMAADKHWSAAGDMESDDFSASDGETVLRGDVMVGDIEASISYIVGDADGVEISDLAGGDDAVTQLSIGAAGTFGNFTVGMAYQEEIDAAINAAAVWGDDVDADEVFGIFASTTVGAADLSFAYASNQTEDEDSIGIQVAYPVGPVTATVYYVEESNGDPNLGLTVAYEDGPVSVTFDYDDDQGTSKWALDGSYDVGNGLVIFAGVLNDNEADEDFYIAGEMDLGGGASLLVSYAEDDDNDNDDEIGDPEYQRGTTVEVSFEF